MSRPALVLSTIGLTAAAIVASTAAATSASAHTPTGRSSIHFSATKNHRELAPGSTRPGTAHLRADKSGAIVVEAERGTGSAKQVAAGLRSENPHKLLDHYRFVAFVLPGKGVYTRLTRGTYYVSSGGAGAASKIARMTVTGSRVDALLPKSHAVTEDQHKTLHTPYALPQRSWLHVVNRSSTFSNLFVMGAANKTTYRTLHDLVEHPTLEKVFSVVGSGSGGLTFADADGHSSTWIPFAGRPGRYVAAVVPVEGSFRSEPHLHKGQVRIVHVK